MKAIEAPAPETTDWKMRSDFRSAPFVMDLKMRMIIGFALLVLSATSTAAILGKGSNAVVAGITTVAWLLSVFLTDKYVHKYPQRYYSYLFASHFKAAILMSFFLWLAGNIGSPLVAPHYVLWASFIVFVFADAVEFWGQIPRDALLQLCEEKK